MVPVEQSTPGARAGAARKGGRPTKLTPDVLQTICLAVEKGNFIDIAAALAGVHRSTLHLWLKRGHAESTGIYREFAESLERALATSEARDVERIDQAGEKYWQAIAWRLERRFPKRWGRKAGNVNPG